MSIHGVSGLRPAVLFQKQPVSTLAPLPRFSGEPELPVLTGWFHQQVNRRQVGEEALAEINSALASGRLLDAADEAGWLGRLQKTLGTDEPIRMRHPDNPDEWLSFDGGLSADAINENPKQNLEALFRTLMAMRFATYYLPNRRFFGYPLEIHNRELAGMMKKSYRSEEFKAMFDKCLERGTFDLNTDAKTGLVKTAGIEESEDRIMSQGWITDSIRNGDRQRVSDPEGWKRVLLSIARFYQSEQPAFEAVIDDPVSYRTDIRGKGVGHLFDPETFIRYDWLNPKRLESHGLALRALCDELKQGTFGAEPPTEVLQAVSSLAKYFAVLDYPSAPSNGPWEEIVYNGFTWDTEAVRAGFESLRDLMHNPAYDNDTTVRSVRGQLKQTAYGDLLADRKTLTELIRKGQRKVGDRVRETFGKPHPSEHPQRPEDASLAFVTTSTLRLSRNPVIDAARQARILEYVEKHLVKENGVLRYVPFTTRLSNGERVRTKDGYLMPNWGLAADSNGRISLFKQRFAEAMGYDISHIEPSSTERFYSRSTYGREGKEAQWFMIAEIAKGYGRQLEKVLNYLDQEERMPNNDERALIEKLAAKQTEFINRGFARITGEGMIKANGRPCEPWRVPEAYQHVSTFNGVLHGEPETKMLPGVNTPLAWASSSLYSAAVLFLNNLRRLEKVG